MARHKKWCENCGKAKATEGIVITDDNNHKIIFEIKLCQKCYLKKKTQIEQEMKERKDTDFTINYKQMNGINFKGTDFI